MILSGSVGLEPILRQAGFSAHANIFSPFDLKPWDEETAVHCLAALAETYTLDLSAEVLRDMCRRLRWQVPHHVQQFFDALQESLRRAGRRRATLKDVEQVYTTEMLGARGQIALDHYEGRLKMVLGTTLYRLAIDLLTEAAINNGRLCSATADQYAVYFSGSVESEPDPVTNVLYVLEHDGYLARQGDDYRFVSGLLEDWWHARHGRHFVPIARRPV